MFWYKSDIDFGIYLMSLSLMTCRIVHIVFNVDFIVVSAILAILLTIANSLDPDQDRQNVVMVWIQTI